MKEVTKWQTDDGKTFDSKKEAEEHELGCQLFDAISETVAYFDDLDGDDIMAFIRGNRALVLKALSIDAYGTFEENGSLSLSAVSDTYVYSIVTKCPKCGRDMLLQKPGARSGIAAWDQKGEQSDD